MPSGRGRSRSRRSDRPRPYGTLCARRGRRWWLAHRALSRSGPAPVKRWATRNGSRSLSRRILQNVAAASIQHHDVADVDEFAEREIEVLAMLPSPLTTREIGEELFRLPQYDQDPPAAGVPQAQRVVGLISTRGCDCCWAVTMRSLASLSSMSEPSGPEGVATSPG